MELTMEQKLDICINALLRMGKLLRECPPPFDNGIIDMEDYMKIIIDGYNRDPQGEDFVNYFLDKATEEVLGNEKS